MLRSSHALRRCLIDQKPRTLSVEDYRVLCSCAEMVVRRLEKQQFEVRRSARLAVCKCTPESACIALESVGRPVII